VLAREGYAWTTTRRPVVAPRVGRAYYNVQYVPWMLQRVAAAFAIVFVLLAARDVRADETVPYALRDTRFRTGFAS